MSEEGLTSGAPQKRQDLFYATKLYPNALAVFAHPYKPLAEIQDSCGVFLDTNVLLLPYETGADSLADIKNVYQKLIAAKRLIIPGQVAREFAINRPKKLAELCQLLTQKMNVPFNPAGQYSLLESEKASLELIESVKDVRKAISRYQDALKTLRETVKQWYWNDPVSQMYRECFVKAVLFDLEVKTEDEKSLTADAEWRHDNLIAPGYKDKGIGDLIIWRTVLAWAMANKKDAIRDCRKEGRLVLSKRQ